MSTPLSQPSEVIDLRPLGSAIAQSKTRAVIKTDRMELIRLVMPAGKTIAEHRAPDEITVHCLEGKIAFTTLGVTTELSAGQLMLLPSAQPHALQAIDDSSVLVTLLLKVPVSSVS